MVTALSDKALGKTAQAQAQAAIAAGSGITSPRSGHGSVGNSVDGESPPPRGKMVRRLSKQRLA